MPIELLAPLSGELARVQSAGQRLWNKRKERRMLSFVLGPLTVPLGQAGSFRSVCIGVGSDHEEK